MDTRIQAISPSLPPSTSDAPSSVLPATHDDHTVKSADVVPATKFPMSQKRGCCTKRCASLATIIFSGLAVAIGFAIKYQSLIVQLWSGREVVPSSSPAGQTALNVPVPPVDNDTVCRL